MSAGAAEVETLVVQPGQWLTVEHDDPEAILEVAVDGGVLHPVGGGIAAPTAGSHWVALVARDPVGHRSPLRWILLEVAEPPTSVVFEFSPPGAADDAGGRWLVADALATVRIEGSRPRYESIRLRVGDHEFAESEGVFRAALGGREDTALVLEGVDRDGEVHEIRTLSARIDRLPPELRLQVVDGSVRDLSSVIVGALPARMTITAEDGESGIERVEWSADGAAWTPVAGELAVAGELLFLRAFDRAGNLAEHRVAVTLDVEAPVIKVISTRTASSVSGGGRLLLQQGDVVDLVAEDAASGVAKARYRVGDGPWIDLPATVPLDREGADTVEMEAWDHAGNHRVDRYKVRVRITGDGGQS